MRAAAHERNRLEREAAVLAGLEDPDTWLSDQVQHGMANCVAQTAQMCRTIAQGLVDAKAPRLAGRLDALSARLFILPGPIIRHTRARTNSFDQPDVQASIGSSRITGGGRKTHSGLVGYARGTAWRSRAVRVNAKWRVFAVLSEA